MPTDLRVAKVEIADRTGPWLQVEDAHVAWSFGSLLQRKLRIEIVSAAKIGVLRAPEPAETKDTKPSSGGMQLPFDIDLQALRIDDLHLAAALGGIDSHWKIGGDAAVAGDLGEIRARLAADRLEGPKGKLTADVRLDRSPRKIAADITLDEDPGGIVAALMQRPDLPDISLKLSAQGDQRDGTAELTAKAGDKANAKGNLRWMPDGNDTGFQAALEAGAIDVPAQGVAWKGLHLKADGKLTDKIRVQGNVEELKLATLDPRLPQPGTVTVDATVAGLTGGKITVQSFDVGMPLVRVKGDGDYVPADDKGAVRATVDLPSLEPLLGHGWPGTHRQGAGPAHGRHRQGQPCRELAGPHRRFRFAQRAAWADRDGEPCRQRDLGARRQLDDPGREGRQRHRHAHRVGPRPRAGGYARPRWSICRASPPSAPKWAAPATANATVGFGGPRPR